MATEYEKARRYVETVNPSEDFDDPHVADGWAGLERTKAMLAEWREDKKELVRLRAELRRARNAAEVETSSVPHPIDNYSDCYTFGDGWRRVAM